MKQRLTKPLLLTLMLIVGLDIGNFFMPMPIYTPLFLNSTFLLEYSQEMKAILLGILIACYGIAQLFAGPMFGDLSDQYGRKKILLISLFISTIGCFSSGVSLTINSIIAIYISRFLIGLSSGAIAVVFGLTADYSNDNDRAKNLGYINIGIAIGAALAPVVGGHLASTQKVSLLGYATPFYFMAILYFIATIFLLKLLPSSPIRKQKEKIQLHTGFRNIFYGICHSKLLCYLILMGLFYQLGTESFYLAAPIFLVKNFNMTSSAIGNHFLLQGVVAAITSWWINAYLSQRFASAKVYLVNILLLACSLFLLLIINSRLLFCLPFIGIGMFGTLCWIHLNNLFSQAVSTEEQGFVFGISQAVWSIGSIIGSILVGCFTAIHYHYSAFLPSLFELISLGIITLIIRTVGVKSNFNNGEKGNE